MLLHDINAANQRLSAASMNRCGKCAAVNIHLVPYPTCLIAAGEAAMDHAGVASPLCLPSSCPKSRDPLLTLLAPVHGWQHQLMQLLMALQSSSSQWYRPPAQVGFHAGLSAHCSALPEHATSLLDKCSCRLQICGRPAAQQAQGCAAAPTRQLGQPQLPSPHGQLLRAGVGGQLAH